jgi:hypothetical protein
MNVILEHVSIRLPGADGRNFSLTQHAQATAKHQK